MRPAPNIVTLVPVLHLTGKITWAEPSEAARQQAQIDTIYGAFREHPLVMSAIVAAGFLGLVSLSHWERKAQVKRRRQARQRRNSRLRPFAAPLGNLPSER